MCHFIGGGGTTQQYQDKTCAQEEKTRILLCVYYRREETTVCFLHFGLEGEPGRKNPFFSLPTRSSIMNWCTDRERERLGIANLDNKILVQLSYVYQVRQTSPN
jgi:hypothetical protein